MLTKYRTNSTYRGLDELTVGPPNAIGKSLVEFHKPDGMKVWKQRFDIYDDRQAMKACKEYLSCKGFDSHNPDSDPMFEKEAKRVLMDIQHTQEHPDGKPEGDWQPEFRRASDAIKQPKPKRKQVIEGLLRQGEIMNVIAAPKVGKSWLTLDMCLSVATGKPFMGVFPTVQGKVWLLDNELHEEEIENRIHAVATQLKINPADIEENFFYEVLRGQQLDFIKLERAFDGIQPGEFQLIAFDAKYKFMPPGFSENKNEDQTTIHNLLEHYARVTDSALSSVHHSSKGNQGKKSNVDVGSGGSAMARAADTHVTIREHEQEGLFVVTSTTRSFPPPDPVSVSFSWPCWYRDDTEPVLGKPQTRSKADAKQADKKDIERICEAFKDEEFTPNDVRTRLGMNRDRAARILTTNDQFEAVGFREPKRSNANKQQLFIVKKANTE